MFSVFLYNCSIGVFDLCWYGLVYWVLSWWWLGSVIDDGRIVDWFDIRFGWCVIDVVVWWRWNYCLVWVGNFLVVGLGFV